MQVGDLSEDDGLEMPMSRRPVDIEDLIPLSVCREAAKQYLLSVCNASPDDAAKLTQESIEEKLQKETSVFKAINACLTEIGDGFHIEKIGFARHVVETMTKLGREAQEDEECRTALETFDGNMKVLFRRLCDMQRSADRERASKEIFKRVGRAISAFIQDHLQKARKEHAIVLFEEIEKAMGDSKESELILTALKGMRRDFSLDDQLTNEIERYESFQQKLKQLKDVGRLASQEPEPSESQA